MTRRYLPFPSVKVKGRRRSRRRGKPTTPPPMPANNSVGGVGGGRLPPIRRPGTYLPPFPPNRPPNPRHPSPPRPRRRPPRRPIGSIPRSILSSRVRRRQFTTTTPCGARDIESPVPPIVLILAFVAFLMLIAEVDSMSRYVGSSSSRYAGKTGGVALQKLIVFGSIAGVLGFLCSCVMPLCPYPLPLVPCSPRPLSLPLSLWSHLSLHLYLAIYCLSNC